MKPVMLSVVLLLAVWSPALAEDSAVPHVSATARDGRVTLSAQNASLREVITELGRASGIEIYLESSVAADESTTIAFEGAAPDDGLRRLLRAMNFIFIYSEGSLSQVRIYTEGRGEFRRLPTDTKGSPKATEMRNPRRSAGPLSPSSAARPGNGQTADQDSGATPDKEASRLRAEALGNPDPEQRVAGLEELAAGDYSQLALNTAVTMLGSERVADVLQSALSVVAGMDTVPLEPILTFVADNRVRDAAVRIQALELLSEHGQDDPRVRELLRRIARSDENKDVRESAKSLLEDLAQ
jgi:hypothetical protein